MGILLCSYPFRLTETFLTVLVCRVSPFAIILALPLTALVNNVLATVIVLRDRTHVIVCPPPSATRLTFLPETHQKILYLLLSHETLQKKIRPQPL